ncbi:hypothetical protein DMN91_003732 [Ooceraea biroi]|uniref:Uncharacterized protein n=1 Tax=Ooceraea biroi TaxID=2015173 RepID=A0A3L8DSX3_OOCBI|nr:hypothetical protein DMN91_003732 [Ooceraea biroi]
MSTGSSDVRQVVPANLLERFFTNPLKFQTFMLLAQLGMEHANCIPANSTSTLSPDADRRDLRLDADAHRRFGERPSREPGRGIEGTMGLPMISVAVFFVSAKQESAMVSLDRWLNLAEHCRRADFARVAVRAKWSHIKGQSVILSPAWRFEQLGRPVTLT